MKKYDLYKIAVTRLTNWQIALVTGLIFIASGLFLILINGPVARVVENGVGLLLLLGAAVLGVSAVALIRTQHATGEKSFGTGVLILALILFVTSILVFTTDFFGYLFIISICGSILIEGALNLTLGLQMRSKSRQSYYHIANGTVTILGAFILLIIALSLLGGSGAQDPSVDTVGSGKTTVGQLITILIGVKASLIGVSTLLLAWSARKEGLSGVDQRESAESNATVDGLDVEVEIMDEDEDSQPEE